MPLGYLRWLSNQKWISPGLQYLLDYEIAQRKAGLPGVGGISKAKNRDKKAV